MCCLWGAKYWLYFGALKTSSSWKRAAAFIDRLVNPDPSSYSSSSSSRKKALVQESGSAMIKRDSTAIPIRQRGEQDESVSLAVIKSADSETECGHDAVSHRRL